MDDPNGPPAWMRSLAAVLIRDALIVATEGRSCDLQEREQARRWLLVDAADDVLSLTWCCEITGLDPDPTRAKVRQMIESGQTPGGADSLPVAAS